MQALVVRILQLANVLPLSVLRFRKLLWTKVKAHNSGIRQEIIYIHVFTSSSRTSIVQKYQSHLIQHLILVRFSPFKGCEGGARYLRMLLLIPYTIHSTVKIHMHFSHPSKEKYPMLKRSKNPRP